MAAQAILGVMFYRRLMTKRALDPIETGELVDGVLGYPRDRRRSSGGDAKKRTRSTGRSSSD
jgi:hypothetical protein